MLKSFLDKFNNTNSAINWLKRESPDDEIIFASAATVIESNSIVPVKWYQQLSTRRVTLLITKNQVALKKNLVSPVTVFETFAIIFFLIFFIMSKQLPILLLALLSFLDVLQQLSYQRQIEYKDIRKIMLDAKDGVRTKLVIDTKERVIHAFFAQVLSQKALHRITSRAKVVVSS